MSMTHMEVDDRLLEEVRQALGTKTKKETVHAAMQEVLAARKRAQMLVELQEAGAAGALDLEFLADKGNYRR